MAEHFALIRRVGIQLVIREEIYAPWREFSHALRDLYSPPHGLPAIRPFDLVVSGFGEHLRTALSQRNQWFVEGYGRSQGVQLLLDERRSSKWGLPERNSRPLQEEQALSVRISEGFYFADTCRVRERHHRYCG
jgi:hypothetical protein